MNHLLATIAFLFLLVIIGPALATESNHAPPPEVATPEVASTDPSTTASGTPESSTPVPSSRQEYRACLDLQETLRVQLKNLDAHVADNNNLVALLRAEAMSLAETHQKIGNSDQSQLDAFNLRLEVHNAKVAAASEQADRVKAEYDAYHAQTVQYNKACSTLVVRLEDRDAVQNERSNSGTVSVVAH